jgi:hypothetical protein
MASSAPHSQAQHHYREAERTRATLGSLGAVEEEVAREVLVAAVHALLAVAAGVIDVSSRPSG